MVEKKVVKKKAVKKAVKKKVKLEEDLPEEHEFMQILKNSYYKINGRTKQDRHKEFVSVFMGSDEGKRVLYEILGMAKLSARLVPPFPAPIDKDRLLVLEGARQLAADIISVLTKEVRVDPPKQAVNKRKKSPTL